MDDSREVIELVNKLQSYFKSFGLKNKLELPQIVVVGAQSSGKSSVLDGLVGFSILPRGSGTVTKCPIIVQLITTEDEEGIEFEEEPDAGRIKDYDDVRQRISDIMERNDGAITDTPIIIRVFSPNVVTLTVVDLPGIKRLTSTGEPSDLEQLIFSLSRKYISEKNAIILAVSPANYDICNSDGLLLAKEADPEGNRTIGVLTKLDLMDEGTNARELLTGTSNDVTVKLGMIGLVNRSQKDIDNNLSVEDQLKKEADYLTKQYCDLAHVNGVPFLRKRLHELLVQHIRKCLPETLINLEGLLHECEKRLEEIPNVLSEKDKYMFVNKVINKFSGELRVEIEGSTRSPEYNYLYGGIKIKDIFTNQFSADMDKAGRLSNDSVTQQMIFNAFRNSGSFDSMFVYPEAVFRKLAQDQVKYITSPAIKCGERVYDEIIKVADRKLRDKEIQYFPELKKLIKSVVNGMMYDKLDALKKQTVDYVRVQSSVVFSQDQEFLDRIADLRRKLENHLRNKASSDDEAETTPNVSGLPLSEPNRKICLSQNPFSWTKSGRPASSSDEILAKLKDPGVTKLIKEMVKHYFDLIKAQTQDYIPKLVSDRLITQFSTNDSLPDELRFKAMESFKELASLPNNLCENRENDLQLLERLKEVIADLKEIHQTSECDSDSGYSDNCNWAK